MPSDSTTRFSNTVENYIRFRPTYPPDLVAFMNKELSFSKSADVADIGSGTGKLTELFLNNGNPVFAVEPNKAMREAGEKLFGHFPNLTSINGTAEATTLPDQCAGFITAAQAFHWFDPPKTRQEFLRIGKPGAYTLLIWNDRADDRSGFMEQYNQFLHEYSTDLSSIDHRNISGPQFDAFFGKNNWASWQYDFAQAFDFEGVKGRYLSSSYAFQLGHEKHAEALKTLSGIFEKNQDNGKVKMWYRTLVHYGQLT